MSPLWQPLWQIEIENRKMKSKPENRKNISVSQSFKFWSFFQNYIFIIRINNCYWAIITTTLIVRLICKTIESIFSALRISDFSSRTGKDLRVLPCCTGAFYARPWRQPMPLCIGGGVKLCRSDSLDCASSAFGVKRKSSMNQMRSPDPAIVIRNASDTRQTPCEPLKRQKVGLNPGTNSPVRDFWCDEPRGCQLWWNVMLEKAKGRLNWEEWGWWQADARILKQRLYI